MKKWQRNHKKCIDCGTTKKPYYAKGMCTACYSRNRYASDKHYRKQHKEYVYNWIDKNPEGWKKITAKASARWRSKNKDKLRKYSKEYYKKNRDKINEYYREYYRNNYSRKAKSTA